MLHCVQLVEVVNNFFDIWTVIVSNDSLMQLSYQKQYEKLEKTDKYKIQNKYCRCVQAFVTRFF